MDINNFGIELLQKLIRYNTTNPPGLEKECILFLQSIFKSEGFKTKIISKEEERPNLYVRYEGKGEAQPLLMYGHVDVVTADGQKWERNPFGGEIKDGAIWGRGALDMKGAVVMMAAALIKMKREGIQPSGDILFMIVSDEENGGGFGAKYICEKYADLFKGVKYAIGEIGGFPLNIGSKKFYPIMIGEKQKCIVKMTFKGDGGHASMPVRGGAMGRLGDALQKLDTSYMPCHIVPQTKAMMSAISASSSIPYKILFKALMNPQTSNVVLKLLKEKARLFDPLVHNTATPTIVRGGEKINVVPSEITLELDGRILPGYTPNDLETELKELIGNDVEIEVKDFIKGPDTMDMGLYNFLGEILKEKDNEAIPMPFLASGVTDARHFSRLGIQTYGFTPMCAEKGVDYPKLIHSANERIPIKALEFGIDAVYKLLVGYDIDKIH